MLMDVLLKNIFVKLLALGLAAALWFLASGSKLSAIDMTVPLVLRNLPPGTVVAGKVPTSLVVTVTAPKIRVLDLRPEKLAVDLDMAGLGVGTVTFTAMEKRLVLPPGVALVRVYPGTIIIKLVPAGKPLPR